MAFLIVLKAEHQIAQRYREQGWVFFAQMITILKISRRDVCVVSPETTPQVKERKDKHVGFLPQNCL